MASSNWLVSGAAASTFLFVLLLNGQPLHKPPVVAPACSACTAGGVNRIAITDFRYSVRRKRLISYELPHSSLGHDSTRDEPWLLELLVDFSGHVCSTALLRGEDAPIITALKSSMMKWIFTKNQYCYRMQVFAYVRKEGGRTKITIPGLAEKVE